MSDETQGAAPEPRCPRCQAVKEPTKAQQQIEGWPCYDPFHEGYADRATEEAQARPKPPPTPELDRQKKARDEGHSQEIGEFLEWLATEGYWADQPSTEQLLADYFQIDRDKIERERRALLDYLRSLS